MPGCAISSSFFIRLIVTVVRLGLPGGLRSVVAESVVRRQLRILNRSRKRAPNLRTTERIIVGLCAPFMSPARVLRSAIVLKPSTLLHLHQLLAKRKYRMLFSLKRKRQPGPKGANQELIDAVVELKRRNPNWGYPRIPQQRSPIRLWTGSSGPYAENAWSARWTATDLEEKLLDFQHYYNEHRTHARRQGQPLVTGGNAGRSRENLSCYRWQRHCRGLYQTPIVG